MARTLAEQLDALRPYSACDVSDALLKLETPASGRPARAGFLADILPYAPSSPLAPSNEQPKVVGLASTLKLIDKADFLTPPQLADAQLIPKGSHWADEADQDTILVIEQPRHHTCAAIGGIMATRMKAKGLQACVVGGRVRDLSELKKSGLPIWAAGQSTVGTGAESKVHSRNVSIIINDVTISPGDIIFADPLEGVVAIPNALVDAVIDLMSKLVSADDKVKEDVEAGSTVAAAFKKHRN